MTVGKYHVFTLTLIMLIVTGLLGCTVHNNTTVSSAPSSSSPRILQPIDRYEKLRENLPKIDQTQKNFNVLLPTELLINDSLLTQ